MTTARIAAIVARLTPAFMRRSLRAKLIGVFAILLGVIALFSSIRFPIELEKHAMHGVSSKASSVATLAAYSVAAALLFEDEHAVRDVAISVYRTPQVAYVRIADASGRSAAMYGAVGTALEQGASGMSEDGGVFSTSAVVLSPDGAAIGTVQVGFWLAELHREVAAIRLKVALFSLVLLVGGVLAVALISNYLTSPVRRMVRTMAQVAAGDLTTRVGLAGNDELGYLARSFDAMVERLSAAHDELQDMNRTLEARVERRTAELRQEADERVRAEQLLRVSEQRFRAMFNSAGIGIALLDEAGLVLDGNAALREMLGFDATGSAPVETRLLVHPAERALVLAEFDKLERRTAESVQVEARLRHRNGEYIWTHGIATIVSNPGEERLLIIVMIEDISEHKHLEEMYRQAQKLEAVGRLAGGIAHDFNNLLTTINGVSDILLEETSYPTPVRDDIEQIRQAGGRAAALTRQLLAFSRRQVLQPTVLSVDRILGETTRMLERLIGENITLVTRCCAPDAAVKADRGQFDQVLLNLVVNARDAMPNGGLLTLETRLLLLDEAGAARHGVADAGSYLVIDVTDTGVGMDAVTLPRIFEPFFTTKEVGVGTGLGLATVYGVVTQSGGNVEVDSEPGKGTTFRVILPVCRETDDVMQPPAASPRPGGNETILLVEDDRTVRALFSRVLRRAGYTVIEAGNGREALLREAEHGGPIDLVISDVIMPEMGGPEAVRQLVAKRPDLKILFLSGYTEDIMIHQGVSTQAISFMQKPVSPADLTRRVREILHDGVPDTRVAAYAS